MIELPSGKVINLEVPSGVSKQEIKEKLIRNGLATESDFTSKPQGDVAFFEAEAEPIQQSERSMGDAAIGLGENALSAVTGATAGATGFLLGSIEGMVKSLMSEGVSEQDALKMAMKRASDYTYEPRTEAGQEYAQDFAELTNAVPPIMGVGMSAATSFNAPDASRVARGAGQQVSSDLSQIPQQMRTQNENAPPRSIGAAGMTEAQNRQLAANQLPIPMQLTKGQATQDMQQQKFERETAKLEDGESLRERFNLQNEQFIGNIEEFIDSTDTQFGDMSKVDTGDVVTKALENQVKSEKKKISTAYKVADNSDGAKELVNLDPVASFINENMPSANYNGNVLDAFQKETKRLGLSEGDMNKGDYQLGDMSVYQSEQLRKFVNANIDSSNPKDQRLGAKLKEALDSSVGDAGGEPYNRARKLRSKFSSKYQDKKLISDLLGTKPGSTDRKIALEKVSEKSIKLSSAEELKNLRRTLQKTDEGKIAFNELAAQSLKDIKDISTGNIGQDERGNPLISPAKFAKAVNGLDESGKLEILFGKKGAEQLRTMVKIGKDTFVSQPGSINTSNTASQIANLLDAAVLLPAAFMTTGYPMTGLMTGTKIASKKARQRKTKKQVKDALEFDATDGENK